VVFLIAASTAPIAFAQTSSGVTGVVTDSSNAVVPEARVLVVNIDTGAERSTQTNEAGYFNQPFLTPGNYRITVEKEGFKPTVRTNVRLEVNQMARLDFSLELGAVTELIEVTGSAPLLESSSSSIGQVIENKLINDLPLNGRNFVQLAILGPGVTGVGYGASGTIMSGTRPDDLRPGTEIFSNGNREQSNNFLMDGVDNNFRRNGLITFRPSVEGVSEFKIQTNLFAAEQGRKPGATVNVISKTGSNAFHGSAYEFLRNSNLDARNYFLPSENETPPFRQNQFGASLGGPVVHNKVFFFGNFEGYRSRLTNTLVNSVPLPAMKDGDFSQVRDIFNPFSVTRQAGTASGFVREPFPNRRVPANLIDPVARKLINAYPSPQRSGLANNHISNPKRQQDWNQGDVRLDSNLSSKDFVYGRYSLQDTTTVVPSTFAPTQVEGLDKPVGLGTDDPAGDSVMFAQNAVLNWTRTFTPTLVMEAKMGFGRFNQDFRQGGVEPGDALGEKLGIPRANQGPEADALPRIATDGYTPIGQSRSMPTLRVENTFNPKVGFTKVYGKHTLKAGFDLVRRQITDFQLGSGNGQFSFNRNFTRDPNVPATTGDSMAAFLLGVPSGISQDFLLAWVGIRVTETGSYVQDDWMVTDKLTLNLGLRYERDTVPVEVNDRWVNLDIDTGKLRIAGFNSDSQVGMKSDTNNLAPRFGFAYRLRETTILRGGYGIFYNTQGNGGSVFRLHRQLPFGPVLTESVDQFSPTPRLVRDGFAPIPNLDFETVAENPVGSFNAMPEKFLNGYSQQFNFQIQQSIALDTVIKIGYVGNLSRRLHDTYNFNQVEPGPGTPQSRRPLRNIAPNIVNATYAVFDGLANYHALQATAERRFGKGLSFLTSYTWSHSIDIVANDQGGADNGPFPQDIRNRRADRATSGFDIKHRFVQSLTYSLPVGRGRGLDFGSPFANAALGGWQINTIVTSQTGLPHTPTLASSVSNAGGSRPDRLRDAKLEDPDPAHWFDTSFNTAGAAWGTPEQFTYGNSSRNPLRGPGRFNVDFSLFKDFRIRENWNLQFRSEFFNLFNTPQFDLPADAIGNPSAGVINSIVGTPRQVQFALRLSF
jgi:outer membrane receptor protein involved in Fe transport